MNLNMIRGQGIYWNSHTGRYYNIKKGIDASGTEHIFYLKNSVKQFIPIKEFEEVYIKA